MDEEQLFNELAGRVEGVARLLFAVIAELEDANIIDQPQFSEKLRRCLPLDAASDALVISASKSLTRAVDAIDAARMIRQQRANE